MEGKSVCWISLSLLAFKNGEKNQGFILVSVDWEFDQGQEELILESKRKGKQKMKFKIKGGGKPRDQGLL